MNLKIYYKTANEVMAVYQDLQSINEIEIIYLLQLLHTILYATIKKGL